MDQGAAPAHREAMVTGRETTRILPAWACRLLLRHRGRVGYIDGPFWMCNSCGTVIR